MPNKHRVQSGDCLSSIARRHGFSDWRRLYDHPDNAALKNKRPNPNLIHPGDDVVIPERQPGEKSAATDQKHQYRIVGNKTYLRLRLQDQAGRALAGKKYRLEVAGARAGPFEGDVGGDGIIEHEIPPDAGSGSLTLLLDRGDPPATLVLVLHIGHLDPVEEVSGVQGRLANLGFDCGEVDGYAGPATADALKDFQVACGFTPDGHATDETKTKLRDLHGC